MKLDQNHVEGAILVADRNILLERMPKGGVTCEVGVASGAFSRLMLEVIKPKHHYMIDSWAYAGRYDENTYNGVLRDFAGEIAAKKLTIIRQPSYKGLASLPDHSIDNHVS